jgi:hypothetical protein
MSSFLGFFFAKVNYMKAPFKVFENFYKVVYCAQGAQVNRLMRGRSDGN